METISAVPWASLARSPRMYDFSFSLSGRVERFATPCADRLRERDRLIVPMGAFSPNATVLVLGFSQIASCHGTLHVIAQ